RIGRTIVDDLAVFIKVDARQDRLEIDAARHSRFGQLLEAVQPLLVACRFRLELIDMVFCCDGYAAFHEASALLVALRVDRGELTGLRRRQPGFDGNADQYVPVSVVYGLLQGIPGGTVTEEFAVARWIKDRTVIRGAGGIGRGGNVLVEFSKAIEAAK